ncbi:hypothetical protein GCM10010406_21660 [Streptomyces thermolineatus]|uniref:Uncharacterized protein n=1 Tax=Streptomyces thermolineatus TaxID=44033 RepID=A0ABP5YQX2_9ACTN
MTVLTAHNLRRILDEVDPHIGRHSGAAFLNAVRFDSDGTYLHAVATDRITLAVSRARLVEKGEPWQLTLDLGEVDTLKAWAAGHDGAQAITIKAGTEGMTVTSDRGKLLLHAMDGAWPEWRPIVRTAMTAPLTEASGTVLDTQLLARWEAGERAVRVWQSGPRTPLVVAGSNVVGLQMPCRVRGGVFGEDETRDHLIGAWTDSLGTAGEQAEMADDLTPHEHEEVEERENPVGSFDEDALLQVVRSTTGLYRGASGDPRAAVAFSAAGGWAWTAHRLLRALEQADPNLARSVVAELTEELEDGEFGETAWEDARAAGHEPQAWADDWADHLKTQDAKRQAEPDRQTA